MLSVLFFLNHEREREREREREDFFRKGGLDRSIDTFNFYQLVCIFQFSYLNALLYKIVLMHIHCRAMIPLMNDLMQMPVTGYHLIIHTCIILNNGPGFGSETSDKMKNMKEQYTVLIHITVPNNVLNLKLFNLFMFETLRTEKLKFSISCFFT